MGCFLQNWKSHVDVDVDVDVDGDVDVDVDGQLTQLDLRQLYRRAEPPLPALRSPLQRSRSRCK